MNIPDVTDMKDVKKYIENLCSLPYAVQQKHASEVIRKPLDYAQPVGYEGIIIENADLIEAYYLKLLEKSRNCPEQCVDSLKLDFAEKVIDMIKPNT